MQYSNLSVLLVEDHGFQRRLGMRLLAELGVGKVLEAAEGFEAIELLRTLESPPDVVLVDLDMPGMDGVEFIGLIAQHRLAPAIAVVSAMDAALLHSVQVMAQASGLRVLGSVEKPLTSDKLQQVLGLLGTTVGVIDSASKGVMVDVAQIREALANGQIVPYFQPQAEFGNGKIVSVEALARWVQPNGQVLHAVNFMPLIETQGMIEQLTEHMLVESCAWRKRWVEQGLRIKVSVNVSAQNLTGPEVADRYENVVRSHGMRPEDIVLEITESSVMSDTARGLAMLARLRLKGFGLSVDDFGTGYSSLAQLSQIPFTELKIDRGFVHRAPEQPRKLAMIETSLDLARKLGLKVVAEGIETIEEWQLLAQLGCDYAQGYLISQAVPGDRLQEAIGNWRKTRH
ncbi:MAG TPA: EAL domain-containing response regulator [Xanthomonadaceae bacterium]|jgi:EAL domain-containing protein (putative c-di-GMP-specific phosphodiesterase class I)|nr:EAL domain-containing response regulator [Xanthomonadaceae bacterium]